MAVKISVPGSSSLHPVRTNHRCCIPPARTRVGQVWATDGDFPQRSVVYSISSGGASPQYPNIFWINPKTGELQLITKVDYETTPIFILRIQATNGEDTGSVTVSGAISYIHSFNWLTRVSLLQRGIFTGHILQR